VWQPLTLLLLAILKPDDGLIIAKSFSVVDAKKSSIARSVKNLIKNVRSLTLHVLSRGSSETRKFFFSSRSRSARADKRKKFRKALRRMPFGEILLHSKNLCKFMHFSAPPKLVICIFTIHLDSEEEGRTECRAARKLRCMDSPRVDFPPLDSR
jgi:hypothetical protein